MTLQERDALEYLIRSTEQSLAADYGRILAKYLMRKILAPKQRQRTEWIVHEFDGPVDIKIAYTQRNLEPEECGRPVSPDERVIEMEVVAVDLSERDEAVIEKRLTI